MNSTKRNILYIGIGLLVLFILFLILGIHEKPIIFELKKPSNPFTANSKDSIKMDSVLTLEDINKDTSNILPHDTSGRERVLLIGDSQLEGLRRPVYNYCTLNNHDLVASILWYGSSTKVWGESDTLSYFLNKYKPTYLFIAIGLNELFVTDMDNRKEYVNKIITSIKKFGVKYFWIGPAAWKQDKGITNLLAEMNGVFFYPSHKLKLKRAKDKMHPSKDGAKIWMDSVATYVTSLRKYGLNLSIKKDTVLKIENSPLIIIAQEK